MWRRIKSLIRVLLQRFSRRDPEMQLRRGIREMQKRVPQLNAEVARVRVHAVRLQAEHNRCEGEATSLAAEVRAALERGDEQLARQLVLRLEEARAQAARSRQQSDDASRAYRQAIESRDALVREQQRRTRAAIETLRAARQARWQAEIAETLESLATPGFDDAHSELVREVERDASIGAARLKHAVQTVELTRSMDQAVAGSPDLGEPTVHADELLAQFKAEMAGAPGSADRPLDASPGAAAAPVDKQAE